MICDSVTDRGRAQMAHILLIEDDPRIQSIVERGLGVRGLGRTCAADGGTGAELARLLEVDLVLLDLLRPDRAGLAVLEEIRADKPRLPVIVLTALDDIGAKIGGLDAGADDYLTKPFSVDELAARVRAPLRAASPSRAAPAITARPPTLPLLAPPAGPRAGGCRAGRRAAPALIGGLFFVGGVLGGAGAPRPSVGPVLMPPARARDPVIGGASIPAPPPAAPAGARAATAVTARPVPR